MKIELITQDFKGAEYMSNDDCPLARAVKRHLGHSDISVGGDCVRIGEESNYYFDPSLWSPLNLVYFLIRKANAGEQVSYTLEIPGL